MNERNETFGKPERLCSLRIITGLFENGKTFYTPLFRVVWDFAPVTLPSPAQAAFSVSKKSFKLAVKRNLIKRRLREAYRKNKHLLYNYLNGESRQVVVVIIYRVSSIADYRAVEDAIRDMIDRLITQIEAKQKLC